MRQIGQRTLDPEIEHEGGAGEFLAADLLVGPAFAQMIGHQPGHCLGEVGIDHQRVGLVLAGLGADADRLAALEQDFLDRLIQADADTHFGRRLRHRRHDGAGAAARMVDAELVFHEGQDREQAGAAERRHAQIFALEREGQPDPGVGEVARQILIDGLVRPHQRQRLQQRRIDQIERAVESLFQHGPESRQLPPVVRHEARQVGRVGGRQLRHLLRHGGLIGRRAQFSSGLEDQMILRVQPDQVHFTGQVLAAGGENIAEHARVQEEGRPHVEAVAAFGLDGRRSSSDPVQPLDDGDVGPRPGQQHG